jgi:succinoglycan biosynthesis transport protein ExoP
MRSVIPSSDSSASSPFMLQRIDAFKRHVVPAVLAGVGVLAVSIPFIWGLPFLYRASATVMVEGQVSEAYVQSSVSGEIDKRLQSIKQEAFSRARLTELVERLNLYPAIRATAPMEVVLDRLEKDIKVNVLGDDQPNGKPGAIAFTITYLGRDPKTAADVTNALASFYVAQNDRMRSQQASRTSEVLKTQVDETKKRLDAQEARLKEFFSKHSGRLPQQIDSNLAALQRLNTQLELNADTQSKLMERRQTLQKQLADLDVAAATASPVVADPTDPSAKLSRARRELADLQAQYLDTYPDVRAKKAEIAQLERDAAFVTTPRPNPASALLSQKTALSNALKEADLQLESLTRDNKTLRDSMTGYEGRVESAPARAPEYNALAGDYASTREAYDALVKKYDQARLAESMEGGKGSEEFRVLDAAVPPPFAAGPNRLRLLIIAFLAGFAVGVLIVLLLDKLDTSFHTIDDLRGFTRVPVLVSIPLIVTPDERRRRRMQRMRLVTAAAAVMLILAAGTHHVARGNELLARALLALG